MPSDQSATITGGQTWTPTSPKAKTRHVVRAGRISFSSGLWVFYRTDGPVEWSAREAAFRAWIGKSGATLIENQR